MIDTMIYGPQSVEVEALLARARTLTGAEAREIEAAHGTVQYAEWDAARNAARSAEWNAALDAAGDAEWNAGRYAEWRAVWDPALALTARHLITPEGFTQAHYDLLTGPWRRVIGKVHPGDAPLTESTGGI